MIHYLLYKINTSYTYLQIYKNTNTGTSVTPLVGCYARICDARLVQLKAFGCNLYK